jgi:prepilin signal peptidase PulO-like enzyme (type II secretory pathway)
MMLSKTMLFSLSSSYISDCYCKYHYVIYYPINELSTSIYFFAPLEIKLFMQ